MQILMVLVVEYEFIIFICETVNWEGWSLQYIGEDKDYLESLNDYEKYTKNVNQSKKKVILNNDDFNDFIGDDEEYLNKLEEYKIQLKKEEINEILTDSLKKECNEKVEIEEDFNENNLNKTVASENFSDKLNDSIHQKIAGVINSDSIDYKEDQDILKDIGDIKKDGFNVKSVETEYVEYPCNNDLSDKKTIQTEYTEFSLQNTNNSGSENIVYNNNNIINKNIDDNYGFEIIE